MTKEISLDKESKAVCIQGSTIKEWIRRPERIMMIFFIEYPSILFIQRKENKIFEKKEEEGKMRRFKTGCGTLMV